MINFNQLHYRGVVIALLAIVCSLCFPSLAHAANLNHTLLRLDRMTASQTGVRALVVLDPATASNADTVRVTFATGFNVATVTFGAVSASTEYVGGVAVTALPGTPTVTITGQQVDFAITSAALTPGTLYGFYIQGITTPAAGQHVHTITTRLSNADVDTAKVATRLITSDQVVITGVVPPTFNLTLSANADAFTADLDPAGVVSTTGITVTAETNATNGWSAWLRSANAGLTSAATTETVATNEDSAFGTPSTIDAAGALEYYQLDVTNPTEGTNGSSTVPTVAAEYDGDGTHGGTFYTTYQEIAYGNGTTDGDQITLIARAVPTAIRAAATDYTDTWTIVGAANF